MCKLLWTSWTRTWSYMSSMLYVRSIFFRAVKEKIQQLNFSGRGRTFVGKGNVFKSMVLFLVLIFLKNGSFILLHPNLDEWGSFSFPLGSDSSDIFFLYSLLLGSVSRLSATSTLAMEESPYNREKYCLTVKAIPLLFNHILPLKSRLSSLAQDKMGEWQKQQ